MSSSEATKAKRGHPSPIMFISIGIGTVLALALITVVSLLTGGKVTMNDGLPTSALVGTKVAAFTVSNIDGSNQVMPWHRGHPGVLIFFASWCGPCQGEMPKVANYLRNHSTGDVQVIGVDAKDSRSAGQAMVTKDGVPFVVVFDPHLAVTTGVFGFATLPETVFVNAKGVVTQVYFGAIPESTLARGIASLQRA